VPIVSEVDVHLEIRRAPQAQTACASQGTLAWLAREQKDREFLKGNHPVLNLQFKAVPGQRDRSVLLYEGDGTLATFDPAAVKECLEAIPGPPKPEKKIP
jgi:hypothetical protein